ncbi:hypothetical protein JTE90_010671 [Oedothorax gibbosus]|uniref:Uncharacterized protein n=1 Tax=Oedothorax gibbosus TaxID=931172 RepID=A0AAV6UR48_9ARAC|nr:hypothetical protein JTE90_010671 [Oedothorax gibbosus]
MEGLALDDKCFCRGWHGSGKEICYGGDILFGAAFLVNDELEICGADAIFSRFYSSLPCHKRIYGEGYNRFQMLGCKKEFLAQPFNSVEVIGDGAWRCTTLGSGRVLLAVNQDVWQQGAKWAP